MIVKTEADQNVLRFKQAIFLNKVNKDITTVEEYPENIATMFATISSWLDDKTFLTNLLILTINMQSLISGEVPLIIYFFIYAIYNQLSLIGVY